MDNFHVSPVIREPSDNYKPTAIVSALKGKYPFEWSRGDVRDWMLWCVAEYCLDNDLPERFPMNGKGLCMLNKDDFRQRAPYFGDVIFNALREHLHSNPCPILISSISPVPNPVTSFISQLNGRSLSSHDIDEDFKESSIKDLNWSVKSIHPSPDVAVLNGTDDVFYAESSTKRSGSIENSPLDYCNSHYDSLDEDDQPLNLKIDSSSFVDDASTERNSSSAGTPDSVSEKMSKSHGPYRLLWEFLAELLMDESRSQYICWEDRDCLMFRIVDPIGLAQLWGNEKCKKGMTYEKMSRALRYYYRLNIIAKVHGKRLTYRFLTAPECIKKGIRGAKPGVPHKRRVPRSLTPLALSTGGKLRSIAPNTTQDVRMAVPSISPYTRRTYSTNSLSLQISHPGVQYTPDHQTTTKVYSANVEMRNSRVESELATYQRDDILIPTSRWHSALSPPISISDRSAGLSDNRDLEMSRVIARPGSVSDSSCHRVPLFVSQFQMESPDGSMYDNDYNLPWTRTNMETKSFLTCKSP